jgi:hypothetical protein
MGVSTAAVTTVPATARVATKAAAEANAPVKAHPTATDVDRPTRVETAATAEVAAATTAAVTAAAVTRLRRIDVHE